MFSAETWESFLYEHLIFLCEKNPNHFIFKKYVQLKQKLISVPQIWQSGRPGTSGYLILFRHAVLRQIFFKDNSNSEENPN